MVPYWTQVATQGADLSKAAPFPVLLWNGLASSLVQQSLRLTGNILSGLMKEEQELQIGLPAHAICKTLAFPAGNCI